MMKTAQSSNAVESTPIQGLAARSMAVDTLAQVLKSRATFDDVFEPLRLAAGLEERDVALARAIVTVSLRRYGSLKELIAARLDRDAPIPARLEAILVTGAAQVLHMDVPDRAAVDVAVRLAQADRTLRGYSGLVNAVLRRVGREREEIEEFDDPMRDVPQWLNSRWKATYGADAVRALAIAHRAGTSVDITLKGELGDWAERLDADPLLTGSLRLRGRDSVRDLAGFNEGEWWVQDAAAALPVRLLAPLPGEKIADLCAAPGGKTAQIAAAGADVLAVDRSAKRLKRLSENMQRLGLSADVKTADVLALDSTDFDAVLLDAPCSATGTLRRHPEIAWTKSMDDVAKLTALQSQLLDKAATMLRPGGRLVYCTCSLEPEEGEEQIEAFLTRHANFSRVPIRAEEIGLPQAVTPKGDLRTLPSFEAGPGLAGMDGFFAARLRKETD